MISKKTKKAVAKKLHVDTRSTHTRGGTPKHGGFTASAASVAAAKAMERKR